MVLVFDYKHITVLFKEYYYCKNYAQPYPNLPMTQWLEQNRLMTISSTVSGDTIVILLITNFTNAFLGRMVLSFTEIAC